MLLSNNHRMLRSEIGHKKKGTKHNITTDYLTYDAFAWYRHNNLHYPNRLTNTQFRQVVKRVNELYAEQIALGRDIKLPLGVGKLGARKVRSKFYRENGKLKNTYHIDWGATKKLWKEDEEEFNKKTIVKMMADYNYRIYWYKNRSKLKRKEIYVYIPARSLMLKLRENVLNKKADAIPIEFY